MDIYKVNSPSHHSMELLRLEERSPVWRVAKNVLNKELRTADKGWSSSLGFGRGVIIRHQKEITVLRNVHNCLGIGLSVWVKQINGKGHELRHLECEEHV